MTVGSSCAEDPADRKVLFVVRCFLAMLGYRTEMSEQRMNPGNGTLMAELGLLFVGFPVLFRLFPVRLSPLPALWLAALYRIYALRRASGSNAMGLWNAGPLADSILSRCGPHRIGTIITHQPHFGLKKRGLNELSHTISRWRRYLGAYPAQSINCTLR